MKNIPQETFLRLPIVIPPRVEQERIVEILQDWDDGIDIVSRLRVARALAVEGEGKRLLHLGISETPNGWGNGTLNEVVASISTGVSVNAEDQPRTGQEVGVLKTTCVLTGIFDAEQHKAVVPADVCRVGAPVTGDTILVSRMNTADLVGRSAYVPEDHPDLFLPDRLWQITTKAGFPARWLAAVVGSPAFRPRLAAITAGTSGSMKNISQGDFLALPIPIPPPPVRERLAQVFAAFEHAAVLLRQQDEKLRLQKAALHAGLGWSSGLCGRAGRAFLARAS